MLRKKYTILLGIRQGEQAILLLDFSVKFYRRSLEE